MEAPENDRLRRTQELLGMGTTDRTSTLGTPVLMELDEGLDYFEQWAQKVVAERRITSDAVEGLGIFYFRCSERVMEHASRELGTELNPRNTLLSLMWLAHSEGLVMNEASSLLSVGDALLLDTLLHEAHRSDDPRAAFEELAAEPLLFLKQVA